jgi:hypothetical protein
MTLGPLFFALTGWIQKAYGSKYGGRFRRSAVAQSVEGKWVVISVPVFDCGRGTVCACIQGTCGAN